MSEWTDVTAVVDLPPGQWTTLEIDDTPVAVFNVDGTFYAIENVCTHDYSELTGGCLEGTEVICPRHGARFDIRTGAALTPPAYEPVATLPTRVVDGMVQVSDDRWD